MIINNTKKIEDIKPMLIKFFWGKTSVSKVRLEESVNEITIKVALEEDFIQVDNSNYIITAKGKKYMYE